MYCWAQYPWALFVSLAATLDSTENPFATTLFFLVLENCWALFWEVMEPTVILKELERIRADSTFVAVLVAHDCGYPLSRYTCRATRVAADFLDFIAFCRCSSGVAPHPLKILVSHLPPPPFPGGVAPKLGSEKVSRYTGVSQLQLRVSRYTVQLRLPWNSETLH